MGYPHVAGLENLPGRPDKVDDVDSGPDAQRDGSGSDEAAGEELVHDPRGGRRCGE